MPQDVVGIGVEVLGPGVGNVGGKLADALFLLGKLGMIVRFLLDEALN